MVQVSHEQIIWWGCQLLLTIQCRLGDPIFGATTNWCDTWTLHILFSIIFSKFWKIIFSLNIWEWQGRKQSFVFIRLFPPFRLRHCTPHNTFFLALPQQRSRTGLWGRRTPPPSIYPTRCGKIHSRMLLVLLPKFNNMSFQFLSCPFMSFQVLPSPSRSLQVLSSSFKSFHVWALRLNRPGIYLNVVEFCHNLQRGCCIWSPLATRLLHNVLFHDDITQPDLKKSSPWCSCDLSLYQSYRG